MRIGGVAGDVADNAQIAFFVVQGVFVDERWDFLGEVDAVDEDIRLDDLNERPTFGCFRHIPLQDVLVRDASLFAEIDGASAAAAERTNDKDTGFAASKGLAGLHFGADIVEEQVLVGVGADGGHGLSFGVLEVVCPCLHCDGSTSVACVIAECCYSATCVVGKELEVKEGAAALGEAGEDIFPAGLAFVAVCELDVGVFESDLVFGEFFEADDDVVRGCVDPAALRDESGTDGFEFGIVEDALFASLDVYCEACIEKLLGGSWRH